MNVFKPFSPVLLGCVLVVALRRPQIVDRIDDVTKRLPRTEFENLLNAPLVVVLRAAVRDGNGDFDVGEAVFEPRVEKEPNEKDEGLHSHRRCDPNVRAEPVDGGILHAQELTAKQFEGGVRIEKQFARPRRHVAVRRTILPEKSEAGELREVGAHATAVGNAVFVRLDLDAEIVQPGVKHVLHALIRDIAVVQR